MSVWYRPPFWIDAADTVRFTHVGRSSIEQLTQDFRSSDVFQGIFNKRLYMKSDDTKKGIAAAVTKKIKHFSALLIPGLNEIEQHKPVLLR